MRRVAILGVLLLVALAVLVAAAAGVGPFNQSVKRVSLKVMTLNIFYGGDDYDLAKRDWCAETNGCPKTLDEVVAAITASGADVVGLEEGENNTMVIADRLGWHASPRTQTISRYPLVDPPGADGAYVLVAVEPNKVVAFASVHLPSDPYGPYAVRDGATAAELDTLERKTRLPMLDERLRALDEVVASEMPVFLVGDFNSPSHLDWTQAVADARDVVRFPYRWPVGELAAEAGFRDSYREAHPDPVETPGFTWTPGGPEQDKKEVHDRIDWVLVAGPAETEASEILGEDGGPDVDIEAGDPFPSDHRGVVSTFSVELTNMPTLVAVDERRLTVGDTARAFVYAPGGEALVAIVPAGVEPYGIDDTGRPAGPSEGEVTLATAGLDPGAYDVVLVDEEGAVLSRSPFWLYEPGAPVEVSAARTSYRAGQSVTFTWRNTPGNRWDWVGLYKATGAKVPTDGGIAGDSGNYLYYEYTRTEVEGVGSFTRRSQVGSGAWPLPPGRYELRLMLDDGYGSVARSAPFSVVE